MFNETLIKSGFSGVVGWEQNIDPNGLQLSGGLTASSTGRRFNDEHPYLTADNLIALAPDFTRLFTGGDVETKFNTWLQKKTESGIVLAIQKWVNKKIENKSALNLLDRGQLFSMTNSPENTDFNGGKFVGFEIARPKTRGTVFAVSEIGLQLSEPQTLSVYLHRADKFDTFEKSEELVYTTANNLQWFPVTDWNLTEDVNHYIGYKQSDLSGVSVNGAIDYTFNQGATQYPMGNYYSAFAFSAAEPAATELWDIRSMLRTYSTNYGINLRLSMRCDYTNLLLEQKSLFKDAISKAVAIKILEELANNPQVRANRHGNKMNRDEILFDINGDPRGRKTGLAYDLDKAIEAVTFDNRQIDPICLPCKAMSVSFQST